MNDAGDDTEVMFEIGVMDHPETNSRLAELAKAVLSSQDTMRQGVERIGLSAKAVSASLAPLRAEIQAFKKDAESLFTSVQSPKPVEILRDNAGQIVGLNPLT